MFSVFIQLIGLQLVLLLFFCAIALAEYWA